MLKVHQFHGLQVVKYPNDHRPAHVHVMGKVCELVFRLSTLSKPLDFGEPAK